MNGCERIGGQWTSHLYHGCTRRSIWRKAESAHVMVGGRRLHANTEPGGHRGGSGRQVRSNRGTMGHRLMRRQLLLSCCPPPAGHKYGYLQKTNFVSVGTDPLKEEVLIWNDGRGCLGTLPPTPRQPPARRTPYQPAHRTGKELNTDRDQLTKRDETEPESKSEASRNVRIRIRGRDQVQGSEKRIHM